MGAIVTVVGLALVSSSAPCDSALFHTAIELSGSDARLQGWLGDACPADLDAARASLAWDFVFLAGYGLLLAAILRRWWPLYEAKRLKALERQVVWLPVVTAGLDAVENLLLLSMLDVDGDRFAFPDGRWPIAISTVSWLKWMLTAASVVVAVMAAMLAVARRKEPRRAPVAAVSPAQDDPHDQDDPDSAPAPPVEALGVCCSGGGIRSAAFSLGALEHLEDGGVMDEARWLSAVSGGAYAATAWSLVNAGTPRPDEPAAKPNSAGDIVEWLRQPIKGTSMRRHRFLRNGPGGLGRPIVAITLYVLFNIAVLAALVFTLAWPLGRVMASWAIQPALRTSGDLPDTLTVPVELWLPGVILFGMAVVVLLISCLPSYRLAGVWRGAVVLIVAAVALELLLVVLPLAMVWVGGWLRGGPSEARASIIGTSALVGAAAAVWRIARPTVANQIRPRLPKLGGLLLVAAALVWGGKVATDAATGAGPFRSPYLWAAVAVGFLVVYAVVGITQLSVHRVYRKRLSRTFGLRRVDGQLVESEEKHQTRWTELDPAGRPELILCCAQQRTGIAPGGLPADTFTISRTEVRMGDVCVPTDDYLPHLDKGLKHEQNVAAWIATTGAALASAMGRLSQGSTNALLAAVNVDLGIWLPNPRRIGELEQVTFPKVRLGYLFKEILGWYDPNDRYVFVADGGHWENLGLVELLRRRCRTIVCLDASGDRPGSFSTLRDAVELAGLELPDVVESFDLVGLDYIGSKPDVPASASVTELHVVYRGAGDPAERTGRIVYAKAQLSSDLDIALRRYAKADRRFPNYSTGNQFLDDQQFDNLVALGRAAGRCVVAMLAESREGP